MNEAAARALAETRRILRATIEPIERKWWDALTRGERRTLVRHAGIDSLKAHRPWDALDLDERQAIRESVKRASEWARTLALEISPRATFVHSDKRRHVTRSAGVMSPQKQKAKT